MFSRSVLLTFAQLQSMRIQFGVNCSAGLQWPRHRVDQQTALHYGWNAWVQPEQSKFPLLFPVSLLVTVSVSLLVSISLWLALTFCSGRCDLRCHPPPFATSPSRSASYTRVFLSYFLRPRFMWVPLFLLSVCKSFCASSHIVSLLLQNLFESVHRNFKLLLRSQLIKLGVTNDGGPQHGWVLCLILNSKAYHCISPVCAVIIYW